MTVNRDFKQLVRARMRKTGEAYTTARALMLAKRAKPVEPDYAKLAGKSDKIIEARTGCTWKRWVGALDYLKADKWSHTKRASYIAETYKIDGWWAQAVAVGYERIKGLRAIGQRLDGTYEASKSKVFPVTLSRLYRAWFHSKTRKAWLPDELTVTTANRNKTMRIKWPDGSNVAVYFLSKGAAKAQVSVQHMKLDKDGQAKMKEFWKERFASLGEALQ
jgi:hypothetical protein